MAMLGADADALDRAAAELRAAANDLEGHATLLSGMLGSVQWVGEFAAHFLASWSGSHSVRMRSTATFIRDAADVLERNARDQRDTSTTLGGGGGGTGPLSGDGSVIPDDLKKRLALLGLEQRVLDELAKVARKLPPGELNDLLEVLERPGVLDGLKAIGVALGAVDAVVNFAEDYADHSDLPPAERAVHAVADAGIRLLTSQGVETATMWLGSMVGSVLPIAGTAAGMVVGKVIGIALGEAVEYGIDRLDDAVDVVDWGADRLTDAVFALDDVAGALVEGVKDVGGAVVEGVKDVGGAVVEGVKDVGGAIADGAKELPLIGGLFD